MVRQAADAFRNLGATVDEVSIPLHKMGEAIWLPIAAEGATMQMMLGNGYGFNWKGLYVTSLLDFHAGWRQRADELSDSLKLTMLLGYHMIKNYRGHYYAKAQNLARQLRAAYDGVLADYDLLLMPTLPMKATRLPADDSPIGEIVARALEMIPNTSPFDVTGHPAMNVPCGMVDGLPVGAMLIGRHYAEKTIYRAADAYEQKVDWRGA
jgi:amidase